jgi:hypothetical protein
MTYLVTDLLAGREEEFAMSRMPQSALRLLEVGLALALNVVIAWKIEVGHGKKDSEIITQHITISFLQSMFRSQWAVSRARHPSNLFAIEVTC